MINYQDKWSRFHHKPCVNGEPSSNNGWIYTAYAKKAIVPVDMQNLSRCFTRCTFSGSTLILRSPDNYDPPVSRDEILGMVSLKFLIPYQLTNWNFSPKRIPAFSLIKLVKQLWEIRPSCQTVYTYSGPEKKWVFQHRNYFWQNNLDQLYRFAFSVPIQDRHFILKCWDKFQWYNLVHVFYACVAKIDSLLPKKSGIKWLKYGGEENKKAMVQEFPEDHPIRQRLGL